MLYFCVFLTGMVFRLYVLSHGGLHLWAPFFLLPGILYHFVGVVMQFSTLFQGGQCVHTRASPCHWAMHGDGSKCACPRIISCTNCAVSAKHPSAPSVTGKLASMEYRCSRSIVPKVFSTPMPMYFINLVPNHLSVIHNAWCTRDFASYTKLQKAYPVWSRDMEQITAVCIVHFL